MAEENPEFVDALAYAAQDVRQWAGDFLQSTGGTAFSSLTGGVVLSGDLLVAQRAAGANMSVDIAIGTAYVRGTSVTNQGAYRCYNDAVVNLTIGANGAGSQRNDIVVAQIQDNTHDGSGQNRWRLFVVQGTAGAGDPAIPASSTSLARVRVASGAGSITNSVIDDLRTTLALKGFGSVSSAPQYVKYASSGQYGRKVVTGSHTWSSSSPELVGNHGDHFHLYFNYGYTYSSTPRVVITMIFNGTTRYTAELDDSQHVSTDHAHYVVHLDSGSIGAGTGSINFFVEGV